VNTRHDRTTEQTATDVEPRWLRHVVSEADRLRMRIQFEVRHVLNSYQLVLAHPGGGRVERAPPLASWSCHDRAVTDTLAPGSLGPVRAKEPGLSGGDAELDVEPVELGPLGSLPFVGTSGPT
jgi:hypothetical protein